MRADFAIAFTLVVASCAPAGQHYETGDFFTLTPDVRPQKVSAQIAQTGSTAPTPIAPVENKPEPQTIKQLIASITPGPAWHYLRTDKAGPDALGYVVELTIVYGRDVEEHTVQGDTYFVGRKILLWLTRHKKLVGDDPPSVYICAIQDGLRGETGKALVRGLGCTKYNQFSDSLDFDPNFNQSPF